MTISAIISSIIIFLTGLIHNIFYNVNANYNHIFGACDEPTTFRVAKIDSGFNLATATAITYAKQAADLWNKTTGKNLLQYSDDGDVEITFLFDERQRQVIQDKILQEKINNEEKILDQKSETIDQQQATFNSLKADYENQVQIYNNRLSVYNNTVEQINRSGGATLNQKNILDEEKRYLTDQGKNLDNTKTQLQAYLQNLKDNVYKYNSVIKDVNKVISQVNQGAGSQFEEGVYQGNAITLYEYENITDLKRLLAHELGHALGFQHVDDPNAIMYYLNNADKFVLTQADLDEYKRVCKIK